MRAPRGARSAPNAPARTPATARAPPRRGIRCRPTAARPRGRWCRAPRRSRRHLRPASQFARRVTSTRSPGASTKRTCVRSASIRPPRRCLRSLRATRRLLPALSVGTSSQSRSIKRSLRKSPPPQMRSARSTAPFAVRGDGIGIAGSSASSDMRRSRSGPSKRMSTGSSGAGGSAPARTPRSGGPDDGRPLPSPSVNDRVALRD